MRKIMIGDESFVLLLLLLLLLLTLLLLLLFKPFRFFHGRVKPKSPAPLKRMFDGGVVLQS